MVIPGIWAAFPKQCCQHYRLDPINQTYINILQYTSTGRTDCKQERQFNSNTLNIEYDYNPSSLPLKYCSVPFTLRCLVIECSIIRSSHELIMVDEH